MPYHKNANNSFVLYERALFPERATEYPYIWNASGEQLEKDVKGYFKQVPLEHSIGSDTTPYADIDLSDRLKYRDWEPKAIYIPPSHAE